MFILERETDDTDPGPGALGRGAQPDRVLVGAEPRRDLRERVQTIGDVGRVAALDAGVQMRERTLLGLRPVAARGGEAAEVEGGARRQQAVADVFPACLGLERGGLGLAVRQQSLPLGKEVERPRRDYGLASLDERHHAREPVAGLLETAGGVLGEADRE